MFSSTYLSDGDKHATINEYELPPRDCFKSDVSFESRYGMWLLSVLRLLVEPSARAVMTCLSVNKDLFMSMASLAASPVLPVWLERSLPARSTSYILLEMTLSTALLSIISRVREKMACERDEAWFKLCEATILFLIPLLYS